MSHKKRVPLSKTDHYSHRRQTWKANKAKSQLERHLTAIREIINAGFTDKQLTRIFKTATAQEFTGDWSALCGRLAITPNPTHQPALIDLGQRIQVRHDLIVENIRFDQIKFMTDSKYYRDCCRKLMKKRERRQNPAARRIARSIPLPRDKQGKEEAVHAREEFAQALKAIESQEG